jgi:hypothetical protein
MPSHAVGLSQVRSPAYLVAVSVSSRSSFWVRREYLVATSVSSRSSF